MLRNYRYRFPFQSVLFKWGLTIAWQQPIVKISKPKDSDPEDSMLIYVGMFDDDP